MSIVGKITRAEDKKDHIIDTKKCQKKKSEKQCLANLKCIINYLIMLL